MLQWVCEPPHNRTPFSLGPAPGTSSGSESGATVRTDVVRPSRHVSKVPTGDIRNERGRQLRRLYSMRSQRTKPTLILKGSKSRLAACLAGPFQCVSKASGLA
jgi:hypothetical protein